MDQEKNNNADNTTKPVSARKTASKKAMEAIKVGWSTFKEHLWLSISVIVIMQAVNILTSSPLDKMNGTGYMLGVILNQLMGAFIGMFVLMIFLNIYDKKEINWYRPFISWKIFLSYIVANFLMAIAIMGGLVLLIVPGIIIAIRLIFVPQLVVDKAMGPIEAIKKSWEITKGNMTYIISLMILVLGMTILGMLALMIGLLVAIPVSMYAFIHAYKTLLKANE